MRHSQAFARCLEIRADQQRFARADHVLSKCIADLSCALRQNAVIAHLDFEADLFRLLERDIEVAGVEDLAQFDLNRPENFILVEPRTDCLPDFGQQFVFFRAPVSVMAHHVIFKRQAQLQGKPNHQVRARRAKSAPFRVRKENDSKVVLPRLQVDRGEMTNSGLLHDLLEFRECSHRGHR